MRNVSNPVVKKIKIYILDSVTFSENGTVYEIMSKRMVETDRPQMAIWRRVAYRISNGTRSQEHVHAHAPATTHTHARRRTHLRTCARAQTRKYVSDADARVII